MLGFMCILSMFLMGNINTVDGKYFMIIPFITNIIICFCLLVLLHH